MNNLAATVAAAAGAFAVTIVDHGGRGSYKKVIATVIHVESGVTASTLLTEDPNPDQPLDGPPELLAGYVASGDSFLTGYQLPFAAAAKAARIPAGMRPVAARASKPASTRLATAVTAVSPD